MVSVVCSHALNGVVRDFGIYEPAEILNKTVTLVTEDLAKNNSEYEEIKDGMDASLIMLNKKY